MSKTMVVEVCYNEEAVVAARTFWTGDGYVEEYGSNDGSMVSVFKRTDPPPADKELLFQDGGGNGFWVLVFSKPD